ncbi:hypothetical protein IBX65_01185 [Candidatus Aerophobetes bacterium]|nr:hypothetical protein [Candidatus Aerophobetes bacterium]
MYIIIMANSPGELIGWVKPVVKNLKQRRRDIRIILMLPPCQYASAREVEVVRSFSEVDYVVGPGDFVKYIFLRKTPWFIRQMKNKKGVCVFLGGDPFNAVLISRRLKIPAVAYMQKPRWEKSFEKFMLVSDEVKRKNFLEKGISPDKAVVVGNLVVDSVKAQMQEEKAFDVHSLITGKPVISIFPGSRPEIAANMALFFLTACELIKKKFPQAQFFLALSSFVKTELFLDLSKAEVRRVCKLSQAELVKEDSIWKIVTEGGLNAPLIDEGKYHLLALSTLALTIPGTNTAELACLGVPMVVALPLNMPELIPMDGLAGWAGKMPFLGKIIKRGVVKIYGKKLGFVAQPNIFAQEEIVPEVKGIIQPQDVADKAVALLQDESRLLSISSQLKKMMEAEVSAADRVAEVIFELLDKGKLNCKQK